jgi:hypothetical protein
MSSSTSAVTTETLIQLRVPTRELSEKQAARLRASLDALAPLFRPRRFLGDLMEGAGKEAAAGAGKNAAELQDLYRRVAVKPFDLRPELPTPFESVSTSFHLHEWEYLHPTQTDRGWHSIRVTTPLTWAVAYASPYALTTLRDVLAGNAQPDTEAVRAFVFRACVMHELFRKTPSLTDLLTALRYRVEVRTSPQFGDLPFVTISAPFRTFRPPDNLVALAAGMAGGQMFAEILDVESVRGLADPVRDDALRILAQHKLEV